jgi:hypothetical protein
MMRRRSLPLAIALGIAASAPAPAAEAPRSELDKLVLRCATQGVAANEKVNPRMADANCFYSERLYLCEIAGATKDDVLRVGKELEACLQASGFQLKSQKNENTEKQERVYEPDPPDASIWISGPKIIEGDWTLELEALAEF